MKKVSSRDFQLNAAKYLRELPIVLTVHNIPVATVIPYSSPNKWMELGVDDDGKKVILEMNENQGHVYKSDKLPNEEEKKELTYLGRPLSGKTATCDICLEPNIPEEFAQKHYNEKHSDI